MADQDPFAAYAEQKGDPFAQYAAAEPKKAEPPPQVRSRTGALYTPPQQGVDWNEFTQPARDLVNPMAYIRTAQAAYNDPKGFAKNIATAPLRLVGDLVGGHAERALGTITAAMLPTAARNLITGEAGAAATEGTYRDPNQVVRPSELTKEQLAERMKMPIPQSTIEAARQRGRPFHDPVTKEPIKIQPTAGSSALQAEPETAPQWAPGIKVLSTKETPTSWTPEAARARIEMNDWHSGGEPGSPYTQGTSFLHKADSELKNRMQYQIDNPNGHSNIDLMTRIAAGGITLAELPRLLSLIQQHPGVALGAGTAGLGMAYPNAMRAALLSGLAAQQGTPNTNGQPSGFGSR